jgi:hypothetical protein
VAGRGGAPLRSGSGDAWLPANLPRVPFRQHGGWDQEFGASGSC